MATDTSPFTLQANPGTDIWRKPPSANVWSAPITRTSTGALKSFRSARTTFWAPWTERYDQAGLLLVPRHASSVAPTAKSPPAKWLKTGIEFYHGAPHLSTVGCDRLADWSIGPLTHPPSTSTNAQGSKGRGGVTLEARREADEHGNSIWIYQLVLDPETGEVKERLPLREVCWILADEDEGDGKAWLLDVSPLVARPEKNATGQLEVEFTEFSVVWDD
ncbi:hypothetical protein F4777DRAFT_556080 [Nemania sp. FL0916]|nr:hypothetical protein F4777DRAFT_556080 [Nemania sp. FL0916]